MLATVPGQFIEMMLDKNKTDLLLGLAVQSISHGLEHAELMPLQIKQLPEWLLEEKAVFVTLKKNGDLRGCIGTLEARESLAAAVVSSAYNAAFQDPRFSPLQIEEKNKLDIHLSILSRPVAIAFSGLDELMNNIMPHEDGLILSYRHLHMYYRGTFLPSVWSSLPDTQEFLQQLVIKAGLPAGFWDDEITIEKYQATSISSSFNSQLKGHS